MKKVIRFGVSLEEEVLRALDAIAKKHAFPNRSQAIRHLVKDSFVQKAWSENKNVAGCIVLIYDHHKRDLVNKLLEAQHRFGDFILATQHIHLDHHHCLETISVKGSADKLQTLADTLIALKGIKHGKLVMSVV